MSKRKQHGFIDIDDVGDGFLFGGLIVGAIFLILYFAFSKPVINECEQRGGMIVKSDGKAVCIDKSAILKVAK